MKTYADDAFVRIEGVDRQLSKYWFDVEPMRHSNRYHRLLSPCDAAYFVCAEEVSVSMMILTPKYWPVSLAIVVAPCSDSLWPS